MIITFKNKNKHLLAITFTIPELTFLCPKTGQPDFATLTIKYIPRDKCIELKSLKQYIWDFRQIGIGYEKLMNTILEDLHEQVDPLELHIKGDFNIRGGIATSIEVRL